jgi:hypothetical protein
MVSFILQRASVEEQSICLLFTTVTMLCSQLNRLVRIPQKSFELFRNSPALTVSSKQTAVRDFPLKYEF